MVFHSNAVVVSHTTNGIPNFRVAGSLRVTNTGQPTFSANPWTLLYGNTLHNGIIDETMAVGFTKPSMAYLSGNSEADIILTWYSCGADCGDSSAILIWNPVMRSYVKANFAIKQDWNPIARGKIVHLGAKNDALASHVSGPFDDCHACQPGAIPVLLAVRPNGLGSLAITDISSSQPATLANDASTALIAARAKSDALQQAIEYYRFLADRCRMQTCLKAWALVTAHYSHRTDGKNTLFTMRDALHREGFITKAVWQSL